MNDKWSIVYNNNQSLTSQWQIHQSDWNSKRDLKKKSYPSASTQAKVDCCLKCLQLEESNQNCTFHNFCRARCDWDNLANGNFPLPQVTRGLTEVSKVCIFFFNITYQSIFNKQAYLSIKLREKEDWGLYSFFFLLSWQIK